jgi:alpha-mannosidase
VSAHRWSALVEEGRGFAVLNDCKYGVNVLGASINLTLLKSALAPDMGADKGTQSFTYALYSWNGSLSSSGLVREGYELNVPVTTARGGAGERSLLRVNSPHIVLEALKPSEDGAEDTLVLRLYESMRTATRCTLTLDLPVVTVEEADMRERPVRSLEVRDGKVGLEFRAFEIKTLRLRVEPLSRSEAAAAPRAGSSPGGRV